MSRPVYDPDVRYIGLGNLAAYSFDFKIEDLTQLLVIALDDTGEEVERVRGDDVVYLSSVDFNDIEGGGTVTLAANLPTDYTLILIQANDEPTQPFEFKEKFSFTLRGFEMALDFLGGAIQRLAWRANRTIGLNDAYDNDAVPFDGQLPMPHVATAMVRINDDGDGVDYGPTQAYIEEAFETAHDALDAINDHIADATDAHDASAISNIPSGNLAAVNVQTALNELQTDIDTRTLEADFQAHLSDPTDAHDASAISVIPAGNVGSSNVLSALYELQSDIDSRALQSDFLAHLNDILDAHDASAISVVPAGDIIADSVQDALEEIDSELQAHLVDISDAHEAVAIHLDPIVGLAADEVQEAIQILYDSISILTGGVTEWSTWRSHSFLAGQAATALAGELIDESLYSSAIFDYEVIRGTTIIANGRLTLQNLNGTWRATPGAYDGEAHGLTFSVSGTGTIQLELAANAGSNGTIKVSSRNIPI